MKDIIRQVLKEEVKSYYKYGDGGYLVKGKSYDYDIEITNEEFNKLKKLNENIKELYDLEKHRLGLLVMHNKGTIQYALDKIRKKQKEG